MASAIEDLGGTLTPDQRRKLDRVRSRRNVFRGLLEAARAPAPPTPGDLWPAAQRELDRLDRARAPRDRPPTAPGEMLLQEFLRPRGVTQVELASRMGVPIQRVNTIVNGKRGITAETAILLAETLDTTPEFWMGLQADFDLWHALRKRAAARRKGSPAAARARRASATAPGRHRSA